MNVLSIYVLTMHMCDEVINTVNFLYFKLITCRRKILIKQKKNDLKRRE